MKIQCQTERAPLSACFRGRMLCAVAASAVIAMGLAGAGCGKKSASTTESTVHKDVYVVRGAIAMLPAAENPAAELQVRHEAIPHFRGSGGKLGMNTMTMPFPLAEGLSLDAFAVGDVVECTFEVDFDTAKDRPTGYRLTAIKKLPVTTPLDWTELPRRDSPSE